MKRTDYIFWMVLMIVAVFYLVIGNDMHDEKYKMIQGHQIEAKSSASNTP